MIAVPAIAQEQKHNSLMMIVGDLGITNISAYSCGLVGIQTPAIDKLAEEGVLFTDCYREQNFADGRASFIAGQSPFRVDLTKTGMTVAKHGLGNIDVLARRSLHPAAPNSYEDHNEDPLKT